MQTNKLQRFFVITPETYDRLSSLTINEDELNELDKSIFNVLKNKDLSNADKWLNYSQELTKFSEKIRNQGRVMEEKPKESKIEADTQVTPGLRKNYTRRVETPVEQNEEEVENLFVGTNPEIEDIFENSDLNTTEPPSVLDNAFVDEDLEYTLFEIALKNLNENNKTNVLRKDETINEDYRVFENRNTGDLIAIEVEPVVNYLQSKVRTPIDFEIEVGSRTDISPPKSKAKKKLYFESPEQSPEQTPKYIVLRSRAVKRRRSPSLSKIRYSRAIKPAIKRVKQSGDGSVKIRWSTL